jgi:hypothetical protein
MNHLGDPNNLASRQGCLQDASIEMREAADNLYYAAKLLVFCSHSSASRVAELADQIMTEIKILNIKN